MNILLVSDDHGIDGFETAFEMAVQQCGHIDAVLHAGDSEQPDKAYYEYVAKCPVYIVSGNNDYNKAPMVQLVELGGRRILLTHGHRYHVHMGVQNLFYAAKEQNADVVVFGHTHRPEHVQADGINIINPGSLTLPRGSRYGSFAILYIEKEGINLTHFIIN